MNKLWIRIKATLQRLRYTEPALLRARGVMLLGTAAALGITLPGWVDHWVGAGFAVLAIAAPYYQGRTTRADVWSQRTVDDLTAVVALFPGLAERARDLFRSGEPVGKVLRKLEQEALAADPPGGHAADRPDTSRSPSA